MKLNTVKAGENRYKVSVGNYAPGRGLAITLGAFSPMAAKAQYLHLIKCEWEAYKALGMSKKEYAERLDLVLDDLAEILAAEEV